MAEHNAGKLAQDSLGAKVVGTLEEAVAQLEATAGTFIEFDVKPVTQEAVATPGLAGEVASYFWDVSALARRVVDCSRKFREAHDIITSLGV